MTAVGYPGQEAGTKGLPAFLLPVSGAAAPAGLRTSCGNLRSNRFLETESDHLALPATAHITVKRKNVLQTRLQRGAKDELV